MPIRGPLVQVEIPQITRPDPGNPGFFIPVIVKMARGKAEYFNLAEIASDDARLRGTFAVGGPNAGFTFFKNIGGRGDASYKLYARTVFQINEYFYVNGVPQTQQNSFQTMSVGLPTGHTVHEVVDWILTLTTVNDIAYVQTPAGKKIPIKKGTV